MKTYAIAIDCTLPKSTHFIHRPFLVFWACTLSNANKLLKRPDRTIKISDRYITIQLKVKLTQWRSFARRAMTLWKREKEKSYLMADEPDSHSFTKYRFTMNCLKVKESNDLTASKRWFFVYIVLRKWPHCHLPRHQCNRLFITFIISMIYHFNSINHSRPSITISCMTNG